MKDQSILKLFLLHHGYQKMKGIPIDVIQKLARVVITENVFVYEKKFCRQVKGGAMGSAFTLTPANIFMWKWKKQFVSRQLASNEIYGRYTEKKKVSCKTNEVSCFLRYLKMVSYIVRNLKRFRIRFNSRNLFQVS